MLPPSSYFSGTQRFRLESLLGRGATGVVYAAFDAEQRRPAALKLLTNWQPLAIERFKNEFRALQDLRHRNLVELRELLFAEPHWFLTMELLEGGDFLSYVRGMAPRPALTWTNASPLDLTQTAASDASSTANAQARATAPGQLDEARVRDAFAQLASGLAALHAAGKVHRDVKPSNVLVDAIGRVVIVDFGLVARLDARGSAEQSPLLGTPRYMSPEQAAGRDVGPASDLYSAGAMLFEALTGQAHERGKTPIFSGHPPDLSALCQSLLRHAADQRPSAEHVLSLLDRDTRGSVSCSAPIGSGGDASFVGRAVELGVLDEAFERVRGGQNVTVVLEGPSGVGKTSLMRRFVERTGARCLQGRCFERESLPYKAIDGVMDALGEHLSRSSRRLPASAGLVGQVFPVLRRVPGFERPTPDERLDPQLQRLRFFAALRELFAQLAAEEPTLVLLDDMQWSDADSMALLSALLAPPDAPRLLLIAAQRPGGPLLEHGLPGQPLRLTLGNLSQAESELLAATLLREEHKLERTRVEAVAHESQGHPLFLRELLLQLDRPGQPAQLRLDDTLWQRIEALPATARRLVQLTAVAGRPVARSLIFAALAELEPAAALDLEQQVAELRHASLLRTSGAHTTDAVEPFHDRIREAVLARLLPTTRKRQHLAVAHALELSPAPDPEALAMHFQAAGEHERAFVHAVRAAEQAQAALAFERAARLYRLSLELGTLSREAQRDLTCRLADALANAGRGVEAAAAYRRSGENDDSLTGLHRQRLAGEQLLRSGHIEAGLSDVSKVLRKLELPLPRSGFTALLSLLGLRWRLSLRGFDYAERDPEQVPARELARIDGLWTAATCLTMFDNTRSAELQCRGILRALDGGSALQVLRAHTAESIFLATAGESNRAAIERVLGAARAQALRLDDPYALGWIGLSRGATAFLLGEWQVGEEQCRAAENVFRERVGAQWELGSARAFGTWSGMMRGRFRQLALDVPGYVDEGEKRGDLYAATLQMTGFSNVAWLCRHDVPAARYRLELAERRWPGARFDVPRYLNMIAGVHIELYEGQGRAAHARILRDWRSLRWGIAFRAQITRFGMRTARGLAALSAYDETREPALLGDAEACARAIFAERVTWSSCFAGIIAAGAELRRGRPEQALLELEQAEDRAEQTGMLLHRALLRLRRGQLIQGDAGSALAAEALGFMRQENIAEPEYMANMLTPRLPLSKNR